MAPAVPAAATMKSRRFGALSPRLLLASLPLSINLSLSFASRTESISEQPFKSSDKSEAVAVKIHFQNQAGPGTEPTTRETASTTGCAGWLSRSASALRSRHTGARIE
jgi:hypothetical protein